MRQELADIDGAPAHHPTPTGLRMRIAELGIRQHRVSARLGISDGHLSNILHEKRAVDDIYLARIAEAIEAAAEA